VTPGQLAYQDYLKSEHWESLRREAFRVYGYKCRHCRAKKRLQVHHHTYRHPWETCTVADVYPVCRNCHRKEHGIGGSRKNRSKRTFGAGKPRKNRFKTGLDDPRPQNRIRASRNYAALMERGRL
jgi:hypothetical protein